MNKLTSPVALVVVATLALLGALYLSAEYKSQKEEIETLEISVMHLEKQVVDLKDRNYHDSTMLSEYQEALYEYMEIDPLAADEFMKLMEKQFE